MGYTLTADDKKIILEFGYEKRDLTQIQEAIDVSNFLLYKAETEDKETVISSEDAIKLLGKKDFLSGICRSAFHWSSVREVPDTDEAYHIMFESDALFKKNPSLTKDYKGDDKVTVDEVLHIQEQNREIEEPDR